MNGCAFILRVYTSKMWKKGTQWSGNWLIFTWFWWRRNECILKPNRTRIQNYRCYRWSPLTRWTRCQEQVIYHFHFTGGTNDELNKIRWHTEIVLRRTIFGSSMFYDIWIVHGRECRIELVVANCSVGYVVFLLNSCFVHEPFSHALQIKNYVPFIKLFLVLFEQRQSYTATEYRKRTNAKYT